LLAQGFTEATEIRFPEPHSHHYNAEFDADESRIIKEFDWSITPLRIGDANPNE
jgi:hypothetical protein